MVAQIRTVAFQGIQAKSVNVQVQMTSGLPAFNIVGLPDKTVAESRERIRAAFFAMGLALPPERITVNMAPADVQKEGSHYDLPVALGLLCCMGIIDTEVSQSYVAIGELGLDGSLAKVNGALPAAVHACSHNAGLICPRDNGAEAAWAADLEILAAPTLISLVNHFKGTQVLQQPQALDNLSPGNINDLNMKEVRGQETAKRALEVAAAGGHNVLMIGPPGSGKSMLAARLPTILPPMTPEEALEVTMIHSMAGTVPESGLVSTRPYRDPHHSASQAAMVGGGFKSKPGEISLAHNGVLFMDELPEFASGTLESLRQPLETGSISIARANAHVTYPANIQLVAAMNPCRCGYFGDPAKQCTRVPKCGQDYQNKISGPLLDRFDIVIDVPAVRPKDLHASTEGNESSNDIGKRVEHSRKLQRKRAMDLGQSHIKINAQLQGKLLDAVSELDTQGRSLMNQAADKFHLSARGYYRVLRLARTLADLGMETNIRRPHIAEALNYRRVV